MKKVVLGGLFCLGLIGIALVSPLSTTLPNTVHLEEMTWIEVHEAIQQGKTSVIIPTAGLEQNGPHVVTGKHRIVVRRTAEMIAAELGDTLVAPVVDYVPEGNIDPPTGHMYFAGTISVGPKVFADILRATVQSLARHGFTRFYFVGDSQGNQMPQADVAKSLNAAFSEPGQGVFHIDEYYSKNGQTEWLLSQGFSRSAIGTHAGIRDTSEVLAIRPDAIRKGMLRPRLGFNLSVTGVDGDPTQATAEIGQKMLSLKVEAAVRQIRRLAAVAPAN